MFKLIIISMLLILPCPLEAASNKPISLSLKDAILLSLHNNPNIQQAQLNNVVQRFSVDLEQWQFKPHYFLRASRVTTRNYSVTNAGMVTSNVTGIEPTLTYETPLGTQFSLVSTNNMSDHYNPGLSFQIVQPLMRGFGPSIVEIGLENARDSEKISQLAINGSIRDTVTAVIISYLDVIQAENTLAIDHEALARAEKSVKETQLYIKAGNKAGVELVTVEADVEGIKAQIENDANTLKIARYTLLTAIGLNPDTEVIFNNLDVSPLLNKFTIPTLEEAKKLILINDTQYQIDKTILDGYIKRSILLAEDNLRWQLNLTVNAHGGNSSGGGQNSGINSLINGVNETNSVSVDLNIPIDDLGAKTTLSIQRIAFHQAQIALKEEKWRNETKLINAWMSIYSEKRSLSLAENSARLQEKSFYINFQKYSHGLIDSLGLQTAQQQLTFTQRTALRARINYLKSMVNLDLLTGRTLQTWKIQSNTMGPSNEKA